MRGQAGPVGACPAAKNADSQRHPSKCVAGAGVAGLRRISAIPVTLFPGLGISQIWRGKGKCRDINNTDCGCNRRARGGEGPFLG